MLAISALAGAVVAILPVPFAAPPAGPTPAPQCVCVCQTSPAVPSTTEHVDAIPRITAPEPAPARWYGGPAVATDAVSFALMLEGGISNNETRFWLGLTGFALGAPINHLAHGHGGRALGSIGLRALATGLATFVILSDVLINHCDNDVVKCPDPAANIAIGSMLMIAAMTIDDGLIARAPAVRRRPEPGWTPGVAMGSGSGFVSLSGRF